MWPLFINHVKLKHPLGYETEIKDIKSTNSLDIRKKNQTSAANEKVRYIKDILIISL